MKRNDELHSLYGEPNIVKIIKQIRLKLLSATLTLCHNVLCVRTTFSQLEGSRKKRRPRVRWLDSVLDLKTLEVWCETVSETKARVSVAPKKKKHLNYRSSALIPLVVDTFTFAFYILLRTQCADLLVKC